MLNIALASINLLDFGAIDIEPDDLRSTTSELNRERQADIPQPDNTNSRGVILHLMLTAATTIKIAGTVVHSITAHPGDVAFLHLRRVCGHVTLECRRGAIFTC